MGGRGHGALAGRAKALPGPRGVGRGRGERAVEGVGKGHGSAVGRVASNILSDPQDVEECVNDTYLVAWDTIPPQDPAPLRTYVCAIARNLALKKYHTCTAEKRNSSFDVALDELADCFPASETVESAYGEKELSAAVSSFLDTICYDDRFIFARRYWYGDSVSDTEATAILLPLPQGHRNRRRFKTEAKVWPLPVAEAAAFKMDSL